jgi:hypothetical protein
MRKEDPIDYPVMALEGLWWIHSGEFDINRKDNWSFTLMIMQPKSSLPRISTPRCRRCAARKATCRR